MNILILAAGENDSALNEDGYPFFLTEFEGIPLLERLVKKCQTLNNTRLLFSFSDPDIKRWHLDSVITQLAPNSELIRVKEKTAGAACTALLAIEHIDNDSPLLILNANDMLDVNFHDVITDFQHRQLDAGTIVFQSIHPRYSYVSLDNQGLVVEAAEKNPISQQATAGFYWFAQGKEFVTAARAMIAKDAHVDGHFYICPVMNEMILSHAKIGVYTIQNHQYHPLKNLRHMQHFESAIEAGRLT